MWRIIKTFALFIMAGQAMVIWLTLLWYAQQGWEPMLINGRWMIAAGMEPNTTVLQLELWALPALVLLGIVTGIHEVRRI